MLAIGIAVAVLVVLGFVGLMAYMFYITAGRGYRL